MSECIFCRIAAGEIPSEFVAQNDDYVAFSDLHPLAPVHLLVVPRRHVRSLNELGELGEEANELLPFIVSTARRAGIADSGYRVVSNTGRDAGQEIDHLHWHIIGGRGLGGMA
jgi:histidine triad (HIT) family protein